MSDLVEDGWKTLNEAWKFSKRTVLSTPEMEVKVEEATSNEEWGPSSSQLTEIAGSSFRYSDLPLIMGTLYRRIQDTGKNWRHVYKSLVVMDYLLKHGSDDAIRSMRAHSLEIQQLTHFHHIDEHKDVGQAIRSKAKAVLELIHDESKLREERDKAKKNRGKYQGYGSDSVGRYREGSGGGRNYDEEYDRSPYESRRQQETPSPSTYRRKAPTRDLSDSESSDEDDREYETAKRTPSAGARGGRPRAPSDERDRAKPVQPPPAASSKSLLFELDEPTPSTSTPFFPPPSGGSGGSPFGGGGALFEPFGPSSGGGGFPPSGGGFPPSGGFAPVGGGATFAPFPAGGSTPPVKPVQEEEWDGFQSFETPKDQKDIWYQHKSLFDLQHLNQADQKNAPPKQEEKKPLGAMLAEKQKNKPGPTLGNNSATFAPFGPSVTPVVPKPGPVLGQPVIPSLGQPGLAYPVPMGSVPMVTPMVGAYPAGYPAYAPAVPGYGAVPYVQGGLTPSYPSTAYKPATSGAK